MGRPREVPLRLRVRAEGFANLPKLSKGPGGCDPQLVLEVLTVDHVVLIGGDRELNCDACRTKPLRRVLEGYFEETFDFKVNTSMVREKAFLQLRVVDTKPPPEPAKGIGFHIVDLYALANEHGGKKQTTLANLLALGKVINTYGNVFEHGQELRGYRDPYAPSTLEFSVEMLPPPLEINAVVPAEQQLSAWEFHLLDPGAQDAYDEKMTTLEAMLVAQQTAENERVRLKRIKEKQEAHERLMAKKLKDPLTWRTNWKELQENLKNDLLRREWGPGMDKYKGFGGWKRTNGAGVQEERGEMGERLLVQQLTKYERMEQEEDQEVMAYVTKRNARRLRDMTDHLREWSDAGGIYTAELTPGQRSLGASISKCLPSAALPPERVGSRAVSHGSDSAKGDRARVEWLEGKAAGRPVRFLFDNRQGSAGQGKEAGEGGQMMRGGGVVGETLPVGFSEMKEAVLLQVLGGDARSPWRKDVEEALQRFAEDVDLVAFWQAEWMPMDRQERLSTLVSARRDELQVQEAAQQRADARRPFTSPPRPRTAMVSAADLSTLVGRLQAECDTLVAAKPKTGDREELVAWGGVYGQKRKQLDMAQRMWERDQQARNSAAKIRSPALSPMGRCGQPSPAQAEVNGVLNGGTGQEQEGVNVYSVPPYPEVPAYDDDMLGSGSSRPITGAMGAPGGSDGAGGGGRPSAKASLPGIRAPDAGFHHPHTPESHAHLYQHAQAAVRPKTDSITNADMRTEIYPCAAHLNSSAMSKVARSTTPTAVQTARGLEMREAVPAAGEPAAWQIIHSNQQDFLFPAISSAHSARLAVSRPSTQQMMTRAMAANTNSEEYVHGIQTDSVLPPVRTIFASESHHPYVPPAFERWEYTDKLSGGVRYQELQLLPELRRLGTGGRIKVNETIENARPDSSATLVRVPEERQLATVSVSAIRPGGPTTELEARFALFGKHAAFSGQVLNVPPLHAPDAQLSNHGMLAGKVALFDVSLKDRVQVNDLGARCAMQAANAKCVAAVFILDSEEFVAAQGGPGDVQIPVLMLRHTDGMLLYNWINPTGQGGRPVNFNPPDIVVRQWKPLWFADDDNQSRTNWAQYEEHAQAQRAARAGGVGDGEAGPGDATAQASLVNFWTECLNETQEGHDWLAELRMKIHQALDIPWEHTFPHRSGGSPYRPKPLGGPERASAAKLEADDAQRSAGVEEQTREGAATRVAAQEGDPSEAQAERGGHFSRAPSLLERVPSLQRVESASAYDAAKGTMLKMQQTAHGIVRIQKALAVLICNAENMMPASDGSSRDLAGFAADIRRLQVTLPSLGFRVLPTFWNKNADEVRTQLRFVQRGFQKGGALSFHDSLLLVMTGHCDGQNIECSMDSSGQTGAMGISMVLSYFTDQNAPALQGKLKLFVFGLALGHPVKMPVRVSPSTRHKAQHPRLGRRQDSKQIGGGSAGLAAAMARAEADVEAAAQAAAAAAAEAEAEIQAREAAECAAARNRNVLNR